MAVPSGHTAQPTAPTAPTPAVDPADTGILATIAAYEKACVTKDVEGMLECMAPNVTWHADLVTLTRDIHGIQPLRSYLEAYPAAYDFEHVSLGRVADGGAGFGFTIALDRDITCRADGPHGDQADCPPSSTLSLTYLVFERPDATGAEGAGDDEGATSPAPNASPAPPPPRITDVFMQREMSVDECLRRYGAPPADYKRVLDAIPLEALRFGSTGVHDPERATQHAVAAEAINEAWRTGDAAPALAHLADDFTRVNALTGSILHGKPAFAAMLGKVFQKYSLMWHSSCIAVTPGNKAVTFFTASAQYENEFCQPSGQSILIFDADNKISHAIEFTTPLPGMKSQLTAGGGGGGAGHRAQAETMAGEAGGGEGGPGEMEERQQVEVGGKQQEVGPAAGEAAAQAEEVRSPEA